MRYLSLGRAMGRVVMTVIVLIAGICWLWKDQYELALLCAILLSLIEIEGRLDPATPRIKEGNAK